MKAVLIAVMLMCMTMSVSAYNDMVVAHYPDVNTSVGQDNIVSFMLVGASSPPQSVTFYIYATAETCVSFFYGNVCTSYDNRSVVFNGRIGAFHDVFEMVNETVKWERVTLSAWVPGQYRIFWGLNLSAPVNVTLLNGSSRDVYEVPTMNLSDSFVLVVTGNSSEINDSVGVNESDFGVERQRYGANDTGVVAQRMAAWWAEHSQNITVGKTNVTENMTNVMRNVSPIVHPVPVVVKPVEIPVTVPSPVESPIVQPVLYPVAENNVSAPVIREGPVSVALVVAVFLTVVLCGVVGLYMLREVS